MDGIIVIVGKLLLIMSWMPTYVVLNCDVIALVDLMSCVMLGLMVQRFLSFLYVFFCCSYSQNGTCFLQYFLYIFPTQEECIKHSFLLVLSPKLSTQEDVTNLSFLSLLFFHTFSFLLVPPSFTKKPENALEEL